MQVLTLLMENGQLGGRSSVEALERLVAGMIDQRVGHAQRRYKVVDAAGTDQGGRGNLHDAGIGETPGTEVAVQESPRQHSHRHVQPR